jgi:hypothetical protein
MNLSKQSKYLEELNIYINTFATCYYEKASKKASFPYCVLIPPSTSNLMSGDLMMFDIETYANELTGTEEVENLQDLLRNNLNEKILKLANNFTSHINFENSYNLRENEHDLLARKITFSARIFYI